MLLLLFGIEEGFVKEKGEEIVKVFMQALLNELEGAIKEKGLVNAVSYCSERALPITDSLSKAYNVSIKRTSFNYRNPKNKPDKYEAKALKYFENKVKKGEKPEYYIQTFKRDGKTVYRFYKPLFVKPLCLNCHGIEGKNIPKNVLEEILKRYPKDRARGYSVDNFRGVIRVEFVE